MTPKELESTNEAEELEKSRSRAKVVAESRSARRIKFTASAGVLIAVFSVAGILYSLEIGEFFYTESRTQVSFEGCSDAALSTDTLSVNGLIAPNAEQRELQGLVGFTQISIEIDESIRDFPSLTPSGWHNFCRKILVKTNYDAIEVNLVDWDIWSHMSDLSTVGSFEKISPREFEYVPPITSKSDTGMHVMIWHGDLMSSLGPATEVFEFELEAEFDGHKGFAPTYNRWSIEVLLRESGELDSQDVSRGQLEDLEMRQLPPARSRVRKEDYAERLGTLDTSDLTSLNFVTAGGKIRLRYVRGLLAQQLWLLVSSVLFGAGISAVLEAFLALAVLKYAKA